MKTIKKCLSFLLSASMILSALPVLAKTYSVSDEFLASEPAMVTMDSEGSYISLFDDTQPEDDTETKSLNDEIDEIADGLDVGERDENYEGDINIYTTYGTLPTLYALLSMYKDIDDAAKENREPAKGYMWYLRGNTANGKKLPENIITMEEITGNEEYNEGYAKKFMAYARKLYQQYPNAHFNLYCDDLRAQNEISFFTYNKIPEEQYNVYLLSDGTGSYSFIKNYFYKETDDEHNVDPIGNATDKWKLYESWYNYYKNEAKKGVLDTDKFLKNNMGVCYIMYAASSKDNIQYYLQWPELMISDDESINEYLGNKMHREKKFPSDIYKELSPEQQNAFLDAVFSANGFTREEYEETYLPGIKDGTKYMIISGTSPSGEDGNFEKSVNNVIEYFGDEYTYLYKPHPSWAASKVLGREEYLKSKGIVELPAQTPMEVILTAYPQVDLGGYNSSLYMSATGEHIKFFFTGGYNSLAAPLPDLYKLGMYPDTVLFNPDIVKLGLNYNNGIVTVSDNGLTIDTAILLVAEYGDNNELVKIKEYDITSDKNSVSITEDFGDKKVKIMLWDGLDSIKPLTEAIFN